jgi:hypothetical protein
MPLFGSETATGCVRFSGWALGLSDPVVPALKVMDSKVRSKVMISIVYFICFRPFWHIQYLWTIIPRKNLAKEHKCYILSN